jgi:isopenicillin-N epimerase
MMAPFRSPATSMPPDSQSKASPDASSDAAQGTTRRDFARFLSLGSAAALLARGTPAAARPVPPLPSTTAPRDERYFTAVRSQFLVPREVAPMNAANLCPMPIAVQKTLTYSHDLDHDLSPPNRKRLHQAKETTRQLLAEFLRVTPGEILLTRNTSEANNWVSSGLDLKPGDEVLIFADNHGSHGRAWREKARRFGYAVREVAQVNPHPGDEYYIEAFAKAMTPRTRVLAFTHITNTVGDVFPAKALCRLGRERGVLSVVDGAQTLGMLDLDLGDIQPDFYSASGHKWLCGPRETGVLYVRKEVQSRLWPTVVSLYEGDAGLSVTHEGLGQRDEDALVGLGEAVRFQDQIGRKAIEARARELGQALIEGLRHIEGVTLWTHPDPARSHAVVAFQPGSLDPERLRTALHEKHGILCSTREGTDRGGLRLAPHFFNLHAEVDRALAALRRYLATGL